MKWLAVDYGDSRTGLAGCDAGETITSPITPQIEEKSMNKVAAAVTEVFAARGAEGLVCGLPKNMDGTEGSRANKSRRFAQRLANTAGVPVVLWDERRTTVSAAAILADNDTFGAKRKERLDSVSAAVILESFLKSAKRAGRSLFHGVCHLLFHFPCSFFADKATHGGVWSLGISHFHLSQCRDQFIHKSVHAVFVDKESLAAAAYLSAYSSLLIIASFTARSKSASSITIKASFAPSSRNTLVRFAAAF